MTISVGHTANILLILITAILRKSMKEGGLAK